jgi:hypothetical protein
MPVVLKFTRSKDQIGKSGAPAAQTHPWTVEGEAQVEDTEFVNVQSTEVVARTRQMNTVEVNENSRRGCDTTDQRSFGDNAPFETA